MFIKENYEILVSYLRRDQNCVKSVHIWSFCVPHFPTLGLNTEIYSVNVHIQNQENSEYGYFLGSVTHLVSRFVCKAEVKVDAISNLWLGYEKLVGQRRI